MKLVTAMIRPFKLDEVRDALMLLGIQGLSVSEIKGFGRQRGQGDIYRGSEYQVNFVPKLKVEIIVNDSLVERVVDAILQAAHTGKTGDGKVYVYSIDNVYRIRTGDTDDGAL